MKPTARQRRRRTAEALKAERIIRGVTRRYLDRERERSRAADPALLRPRFWWVR
jgi:hypothetical protein